MTIAPFADWKPDSVGVNRDATDVALNVIPAEFGYEPLRQLAAISDAVPATVIGGGLIRTDTGGGETFAGTSTKLYQLNGTAWTDVTRTSGGDYATSSGESWRFAQFGTLAIATNFSDDVQKFDTSSSTDFEALGGNPPTARYIAVVNNFLVLANLGTGSRNMQWSGSNDAEFWTAGTNQSDTQTLPDGGPIQGIIGGEVGTIFQQNVIRRMTYVPGSPLIFQIDVMEEGRGVSSPNSIVQVGRRVFYLGEDGFYLFDGQQSTPIGDGRVDKYFAGDARQSLASDIAGAADPVNRLVFWAYVSNDNVTDIPDKVIIYNWERDRWAQAELNISFILPYITQGQTLEELDSFGTMDTLEFSLDSPFWSSGSTLFAAFNSDNELSTFTGDALEATIETGDFQLIENKRAFVSALSTIIDADSVTAQIGTRERIADSIRWRNANSMSRTGKVPAHASGRFHRARISIPAASEWTEAQGVEADFQADGDI